MNIYTIIYIYIYASSNTQVDEGDEERRKKKERKKEEIIEEEREGGSDSFWGVYSLILRCLILRSKTI